MKKIEMIINLGCVSQIIDRIIYEYSIVAAGNHSVKIKKEVS